MYIPFDKEEMSVDAVPGLFAVSYTHLPYNGFAGFCVAVVDEPGNVCICRKSRWRCFTLGFGHVIAFVCGFIYVD